MIEVAVAMSSSRQRNVVTAFNLVPVVEQMPQDRQVSKVLLSLPPDCKRGGDAKGDHILLCGFNFAINLCVPVLNRAP